LKIGVTKEGGRRKEEGSLPRRQPLPRLPRAIDPSEPGCRAGATGRAKARRPGLSTYNLGPAV
jgi:hypothetical protein